jgi:hypothetical protein
MHKYFKKYKNKQYKTTILRDKKLLKICMLKNIQNE